MKIVVVPSGFKESLSAEEVGNSISRGINKVNPYHDVTTIPMVDGGEGFVDTITKLKEGRKVKTQVLCFQYQKMPIYIQSILKDNSKTLFHSVNIIQSKLSKHRFLCLQ